MASAQSFTKKEQKSIDSLQQVITSSKSHDTTKVISLLELANYFYMRDPDSSINLSLRAQRIAEKIDYDDGKSNSYGWLGYLYQQKGNVKKAIYYSHKSLSLVRKKKNTEDESVLLNNIGYIYQDQGDFKEAMMYYRQGLKLQRKNKDLAGIAISLNNIGLCFNQMGNNDSAIFYYHQSIKYREKAGDRKGMARSLLNMAAFFKKQNKLDSALRCINESIIIDKSLFNKEGLAIDYFHLSAIYGMKNDYSKAIEAGEYSLSLAQEINFPGDIAISAELLSRLYEKVGKFKEALSMHQLYMKNKELLDNNDNKKALAMQSARYEYEKQKVIDDAQHKKVLKEKELKQKQQRIITYAVAIGLIIVVAFLFVLFRRLSITRSQKRVIEKQKQEIVDSINYAKRIQTAILPPDEVVEENLPDSFVLYLPKDIVAGDFYWTEKVNDTVIFATADCTGHGVPGALVSVVCHNALSRATREHKLIEPADILNKTKEIVVEQFKRAAGNVKDGMDIALCSITGMKLKFAGANNPLILIRNNEIIEYRGDRQPIGVFEHEKPFVQHEIELQNGDQFFIFTDGYSDQFGGPHGKKYKSAAFKKLLLEHSNQPISEIKSALETALFTWMGGHEQVDDICIVGVRIKKSDLSQFS